MNERRITCQTCQGKGRIPGHLDRADEGPRCETCKGHGYLLAPVCGHCSGRGHHEDLARAKS